jgi:hypothetical protein
MKKAELFKILSDPNCDSRYIEQALRLYSPEDIIKIPAISFRSLYKTPPISPIIYAWFKMLEDPNFSEDFSEQDGGELMYYLRAYYAPCDEIFYKNMSMLKSKSLLNKLKHKFKASIQTSSPSFYLKRCAFSLYAYNLISMYVFRKIINQPIGAMYFSKWDINKLMTWIDLKVRFQKLLRPLYSKSVNTLGEFIAIEFMGITVAYAKILLTLCRIELGLDPMSIEWVKLLNSIRTYAEKHQIREDLKIVINHEKRETF